MPAGTFYAHSGWFGGGVFLVPVLMLPATFALGAIHGFSGVHIPIVYLALAITLGTGIAAGYVAGKLLIGFKVRSTGLAAVVGFLTGLHLLYFCWVFFVFAVVLQAGEDLVLTDLALSPVVVWEASREINAAGSFSMFGQTPTGAVLWALWGIEAVVVVGLCVVIPYRGIAGRVFCEDCGRWAKREKGFMRAAQRRVGALVAELSSGEAGGLQELRLRESGSGRYLRVDVSHCVHCNDLYTVSLSRVTQIREDGGRFGERTEVVLAPVFISSEDYRGLKTLRRGGAAKGKHGN